MMSEHFLQFIWKYQLFELSELVCTSGEKVKVLHAGSQNGDAGPDFFNAKLQIDGQLWAGNVEVHQNTSDWLKHNHHTDKAYDSVIMHVVANHDDVEITRTTGTPVKCAVLHFDKSLEARYREMISSSDWIPCERHINEVDRFLIKQFLGRLLVEKLGKKVEAIEHELKRTSSNWEEVSYIFLLRNFGFSINSLPFELLAKALPHQRILKHRNNRLSIEALLFGQAGLLCNVEDDTYTKALKLEYQFLSAKYKLKPLDRSVWKFLRTRPQNFPTIRIAQLASLLHKHPSMFASIVKCSSFEEFCTLFSDIELSPYWKNHFVFGKPTVSQQKHLGNSALNLLGMNLLVPFVFAYGHLNDAYPLKEKALDMLDAISPDKNSVIDRWRRLGMPVKSAFYTQALLHLKKEYCDEKRCLCCPIGKKIVEGDVRMR
jgi:hypothetical protein